MVPDNCMNHCRDRKRSEKVAGCRIVVEDGSVAGRLTVGTGIGCALLLDIHQAMAANGYSDYIGLAHMQPTGRMVDWMRRNYTE